MNRRGFIRTALCGAGATVGALLAGKVAAKAPEPGALWAGHGTLVSHTGPEPDSWALVLIRPDGCVEVKPSSMQRIIADADAYVAMGIPRAEFPEFDAKHGAVTIFAPASVLMPPAEWTVPMIRAHYLYALGQRTPNAPVDGNHLAVRFAPKMALPDAVLLNGYSVVHIDESYDGPNGWVAQFELGERGTPIIFNDGIRRRILTGDVQHWAGGKRMFPSEHTAPLLK